jgi:glycosyltransferase involved in cell wall biosynthesis
VNWWSASLFSRLPASIEGKLVAALRSRARSSVPPLRAAGGKAQLLIDVSAISHDDGGTGIQRVVRSVANGLLADPPAGYEVRTVGATRKKSYSYVEWPRAHSSSQTRTGLIETTAGDIFLGLDLGAHVVPTHKTQLMAWRTAGVTFHFVVYDLLPLLKPEWFSARKVTDFRLWMRNVAGLADSLICISSAVETDLHQWLKARYGLEPMSIPTCVVPMGCDVKTGATEPNKFAFIRQRAGNGKLALMVGTLEPRKGYSQVLDAFEGLWSQGAEHVLVIVGRPGWRTAQLQERLRGHPQSSEKLIWIENARDEDLVALYVLSDGLIQASEAEGYGLPVLEAVSYGKPVLARDLAVFREQRFFGITYFDSSMGCSEFAQAIDNWLSQSNAAKAGDQKLPQWRDTVEAISHWLNSIAARDRLAWV